MKLSDKLKTLRKSRRISLTELSKRSGVNKGYLSSMETGRQDNPGLEIMSKLAKELSVELNYFSEEFNPQKSLKTQKLPKGLKDFISERKKENHSLSTEDIEDLNRIAFRGKNSFTPQEYALLYAHLELSWKNKKR